jgi:hypothetical protein
MLFWALLAAGQITCAKSTDGRPSLAGSLTSRLSSLPDPISSFTGHRAKQILTQVRMALRFGGGAEMRGYGPQLWQPAFAC